MDLRVASCDCLCHEPLGLAAHPLKLGHVAGPLKPGLVTDAFELGVSPLTDRHHLALVVHGSGLQVRTSISSVAQLGAELERLAPRRVVAGLGRVLGEQSHGLV